MAQPADRSELNTRPLRTVEVKVLGRDLTIRTQDDPDHVRRAADLVQEKVAELRRLGAAVASDRLMALVALNLAGELLLKDGQHEKEISGLLSQLDEVALQAKGLVGSSVR